jgi:hypothetical protein
MKQGGTKLGSLPCEINTYKQTRIVTMQRSALAFRKRAPSALRRKSTSALAGSPEDLEFLRARKFSNKLIDYAARGETQGGFPQWTYAYQSKGERKDRLARPIRNASKLVALQPTATWDNLPLEPLDLAEASITTPPGTFVELRRFLLLLSVDMRSSSHCP